MKTRCLCAVLVSLLSAMMAYAQGSVFPIAAELHNTRVKYPQLLDTALSCGFNMTTMGGFTNKDDLLAKLNVFKQKGIKAIVHLPMYQANSMYNIGRFASGVHRTYYAATDSVFSHDAAYGYKDGSFWSSANPGFMLYWDSAGIFANPNGRYWEHRNNYEHRMPMSFNEAFSETLTYYTAVFNLKYNGTSGNDSVCKLRLVRREYNDTHTNAPVFDSTDWRVLKTSDFAGVNVMKACTLSYFRKNGQCRWFDYEMYNLGAYTVSLSYINMYDAIYDSLLNGEFDRYITNQQLTGISDLYSDTSVVYRFYMWDEPVRSQLDAYRLVNNQLKNSGTNIPGIAHVCPHYPCDYNYWAHSSFGDTTHYADFVAQTVPAQLMIDPIVLFGDSGHFAGAQPINNTVPKIYRTPVDSGYHLQYQLDVLCKYFRAANRAVKLATPEEIPFWYVLTCTGDSLSDSDGNLRGNVEGRYRPPTPREMRCMANLSLAHGAKGLAYYLFTGGVLDYYPYTGVHQNWYQAAPVDTLGNIRNPELFNAMKDINTRITAMSSTLLNLSCDQSFRSQGGAIPAGGFITDISDSLVQVGLFHHKINTADKYFYLVNRHCLPTDTLAFTITVNYAAPSGYDRYYIADLRTGQPVSGFINSNQPAVVSITLDPGDGSPYRLVPVKGSMSLNDGAAYTNFKYCKVGSSVTLT